MIRTRHSLIAFSIAMACLAMACLAWVPPALARTLHVGPTRTLKLPSQAATAARPGDTIRIDPGTYVDCAVWRAPGLTILGPGRPVVITGPGCLGQALFVIYGNNVTIQGLTFRDATVPGRNGAGIKMLGDNLTVRHSAFLHNENGILTGGSPASVLRVSDSRFIGNGACIIACAHGIYAGAPINRLEIERCVFLDTRTAHHIKSRAHTTIVRDSRIEDGPSGTASYLIETPNGGDLLVEHTVLEKGPNSENRGTAISIGTEAVTNPTHWLLIRDNQFRNDMPVRTVFVRNAAKTPAALTANQITGDVQPLAGPGTVSP
ncbi:right-handed parallel beta-helix repeat-containing protein [Rhodopila sp.]|uniref:right-handed parallel beta-helix repeat-containing protein n=1 Tax=Rhodopila sp. TaxID=2480087 RepID=UPI002CA43BC9|nr:right-handed parallel beta-helix repeat-containing protein [Rhodopila sp.]HVZ06462.1 right-handed parallel beta-helix repeat-containing protein [Rhodopila sp.]